MTTWWENSFDSSCHAPLLFRNKAGAHSIPMSQCVRLKEWYCRAQQQNFWHRFLKNFLRPSEFYSIKRLSDNHDVLKVDSHSSGRRGEEGGGGGTVYTSAASDSGTGYKNHCFPLEEGIFYFRLTLENRAEFCFPQTLVILHEVQMLYKVKTWCRQIINKCATIKMSTTIFCLLSGTGSESHFFFVLNRSSLRRRHNRLI